MNQLWCKLAQVVSRSRAWNDQLEVRRSKVKVM